MASATMTMIGLYNYDNTLFDNLTFPSGIDKNLAINQILMSCGEFELLYPNLEFMKYQIENWGKKNYFTFDKWVKALAEEFNPLYNYDRHEEYEDFRNRAASDKSTTDRTNHGNAINIGNSSGRGNTTNIEMTSDKSVSVVSGNAATSNTTHTDNDSTVTRDVSAYDATTYQPKEKETTRGGNTASGSAVTNENTKTSNTDSGGSSGVTNTSDAANNSNITNTRDVSKNETFGSRAEAENAKHTAHLYGNIGVTTSVAMLNEYVGFYKDFNLYEQIADLFVNDFCVRIY